MPFPLESRRQAERCTFHASEADVPRGQTVNMADSDSDVEMLENRGRDAMIFGCTIFTSLAVNMVNITICPYGARNIS
jgi:hypothetical protein